MGGLKSEPKAKPKKLKSEPKAKPKELKSEPKAKPKVLSTSFESSQFSDSVDKPSTPSNTPANANQRSQSKGKTKKRAWYNPWRWTGAPVARGYRRVRKVRDDWHARRDKTRKEGGKPRFNWLPC